jgi:outer membrane protein assembly factor BamB
MALNRYFFMKKTIFSFYLLFLCYTGFSQVTAQWRGPQRDGIYPETGLLKVWPAEGPKLLWSAQGFGTGYSSAACDGKNIYVTGMINSKDVLTALTLDGKILWQTPYGASWTGSFPDTRGTPTVDGDKIYLVSGSGDIACIQTKDGSIKWTFNGFKKFEGKCGDWGVCESLLVVDDKVFYTPAGFKTTMVALNKNTGETVWQSESISDTTGYVSPLLVEYRGRRYATTLLANYLIGVDIEDGTIRGKVKYTDIIDNSGNNKDPEISRINTVTPLYKDGFIYVTSGYNRVGAMFDLSSGTKPPAPVWVDPVLDCHHGGVVLMNGYIFGSNWINNGNGNWCCIDWKTGKKMYEEKWFTKGSIVAADGMLYCTEEKTGNLALVRPNPEKLDIVSSFKIPLGKGPFWAHPFIKDGIMYIRHGDVLMAYDVKP